jgi:3-oxoadipate enol-lactonase
MPQASVRGATVNYLDSGGDGLPVLLLHAFPLNSGMWEPQIDALGSRYRLVAPDLRGFGGSDVPEDPAEYSMDAYADDLKALLDHLGIEKVVLCGLSMGGYVSFSFLRRHGDMVRALVLADTRAGADTPEGIAGRKRMQQQVRKEGTSGVIQTLCENLLTHMTTQRKPDVTARARELMDNPAAGFIGALEAIKNRPDSTADLEDISVPVLVIVGEQDGVTPPDAAREMHERIEGSIFVVIPDAGHLSNLETPEVFTGALTEFLEGIG